MIELEQLYNSADKYLLGKAQNWDSFVNDFSTTFSSKMTLYRPSQTEGSLDFRSMNDLIATTNRELMAEFFEREIIKFGHMFEDAGNPFEPFRRTDVISDDNFKEAEVTKAFLQPNNVFYLMIVHAVLSDGSKLVLYLWRDELHDDFSDIEKQRLTLFMRYLAKLVLRENSKSSHEVGNEVKEFGKKHHLTEAEVSILSALLDGKSLRFIAENSSRSYGTVRWHVQNILNKCQVKSKKNLLSEFYSLIKA